VKVSKTRSEAVASYSSDCMEVTTGSDSDRVSIWATVEFAETITRSLPLPVPTSSLNLSHEGGCLFSTWEQEHKTRCLTLQLL